MADFFSGYIEGYYGRSLSWIDRQALIYKLQELGLNTYVYAPKEDPFHRRSWKIPYPKSWREELDKLIELSYRKRIQFIPSVAPGLQLDYLSSRDFSTLWNKLKIFFESGVNTCALLMDDISAALPENCRGRFQSLGEAHGQLLQKLMQKIQAKFPAAKIWFCPTVYSDYFFEKGQSSSLYLEDLARFCPENVSVFWTGNQVIAETVNPANTQYIRKLFPGRVILWDNFFAHDYCPRKLMLGLYKGRSPSLKDSLEGILLNPTGMFHTDVIFLILLKRFLKGESSPSAWRQTVKGLPLPDGYSQWLKFLPGPFQSAPPVKMSAEILKKTTRTLQKALFEWNHPLAEEWFSFLQGLKQDLTWINTVHNKNGAEQAMFLKKYPAVLAAWME